MPGIDSSSKLIVQCNGSGATFIDSEPTIAKTINVNGNASQAPIKLNQTAGWFNGASVDTNYIFIPDSSDFNFATGDYTIEAFVCFDIVSGQNVIFEDVTDGSNYARLEYSGGAWKWVANSGGSPLFAQLSYAHSPILGSWYHIAVVRNGTDTRMYLDGVSVDNETASYTYPNYTAGVYIGGTTINASYGHKGWIKELRVSNSARYTSSFTPTTTEFTGDSNTKLLLHFDNPFATSPIGPAIKLDGIGDYLSLTDSSDWDFGTGDYTVEGWFRWSNVNNHGLISRNDGGGSGGWQLEWSSGVPAIIWSSAGSTIKTSPSFTPITNRWYHFAVSRTGTTVYMFIDGVQQGATGTDSANISGSDGIVIGRFSSGIRDFEGWFKNIRISNSARYTSAFTPTQSPFVVDSNTKLLIRGDESNGATTFIDSETSPKTVTTNGNAVIAYIEDYRAQIVKDDGNTGHKPYVPVGSRAKVDFLAPFGSGVGIFDGTGDYLTVPDSTDWDFGTGDFTLEGFFRFRSIAGSQALIECGDSSTIGEGLKYNQASGQLRLDINGATILNPAFVPVVDTWYHLAASRVSGSAKVFSNGVLLSSASNSDNVSGSSAGVYIGYNVPGTGYLNGYLDNARISNEGRYSATFNPPEEFTNALGFMSFFLDM